MGSSIASLVCLVGIAGLFFLGRDNSVRTSRALWLPVLWLWIVGSRPVSDWLGMGATTSDAMSQMAEGSPLDRFVFTLVLAAGIIVLIGRSGRTKAFLRTNCPIVIFFVYCLLSVSWSDFPDIAFKRWIKAIGDLVMVLVVVTDVAPVAALRRLFSRVGFLLLPASVFLIKYSELGRGYDPDGRPMITGVTSNKNMLGVTVFVVSLGALWNFLNVLRAKRRRYRARHLLAWGTLLSFGVALLGWADSATSVACFALGAVLILATSLRVIRRRPGAVHALVTTIVLAGGLTLVLGGQAGVVHALGRQTNLTGRTEIWAAVLPVVRNPVLGCGFESFWLGPRVYEVWSHLSQYMHVNEAHNGYIEIYLNLGWVGVSLIAITLISGYRGAVAAFRRDPTFGSLMLAYVSTAAIYSVTEAGFRMLDPIWIFLLLAVVGAHGIAAGVGVQASRPLPAKVEGIAELSASHAAVGVKR
jgi:exopolysaccharide production protein ExoQ